MKNVKKGKEKKRQHLLLMALVLLLAGWAFLTCGYTSSITGVLLSTIALKF